MEEKILDTPHNENKQSNIFSKLSFVFALVSLILIVFLFSKIPSSLKPGESIFPPLGLVIVTQLSCLSGVTFTIMSYVRKEKLRYIKGIGTLLNILIFVLIVGLIIFARLMG